MDKTESQTCSNHLAMKVRPLMYVSCSLVMVLSIAGVVMAQSHEVSLALFITILFLSTFSGAIMLGGKIVREAGNSKYQVRLVLDKQVGNTLEEEFLLATLTRRLPPGPAFAQ